MWILAALITGLVAGMVLMWLFLDDKDCID